MTTSDPFLPRLRRGALARRPAVRAAVPDATRRPTVTQILRRWGPWVCCQALLGLCEDGIPLTARFYNPQRTSHYLFYGHSPTVLATLAEPVLYSMVAQPYGPEHWRFLILSEEETRWAAAHHPHCQAVISPYGNDGDKIIPALAGLMEQRSMGRMRGPKYIVLLHDLGAYWEALDEDSRLDLLPLLRRGHEFGIHVLVTLRYQHHFVLPDAVRRLLRHRLYGHADAAALPNTPAFRDLAEALSDEISPYQAWVLADGEWMRYTAPRVG